MDEKTKIVSEQWKELVGKILETYKTAREARRTETNNNDKLALSGFCKICVKMLDLVENVSGSG